MNISTWEQSQQKKLAKKILSKNVLQQAMMFSIVSLLFINSLQGQTIPNSTTYYPGTQDMAQFQYLIISDLGKETINVKQYDEDQTKPDADINLSKIADNVYNWQNIMENDQSKLVVMHPDGTLIYMKVKKDFLSINWEMPLTPKLDKKFKMTNEDIRKYIQYADETAKNAYLKKRGILATNRASKITPQIKSIKAVDQEETSLKMCKDAHNSLFNNPTFEIKDLAYVKGISMADWKIVRDEIYNTPLYRVKIYIVIAKSKKTEQCYVMYSSITQEYAGGWQTARCSTPKESDAISYILDDNEKLKWRIPYEIECF